MKATEFRHDFTRALKYFPIMPLHFIPSVTCYRWGQLASLNLSNPNQGDTWMHVE